MTLNMKIMEERAEAKQIGELLKVVSMIRALRDDLPYDKLISSLKISNAEYDAIIEMIDSSPDRTDEDIAVDILGYTE